METRTVPPSQASARLTELGEAFDRTLFEALDALEARAIPYALIGGIAASGLGRPRSTHDIDIFVRPEDAEASIEALTSYGFDTDRTDPRWLFKGWKNQMMVDVIFKSQGDIYFDREMQSRSQPLHYHGRDIAVVSPEDLIIIKCAVHSEVGPHHWHDALAVLSHATIDWSYLLKRARRAPRRVLALLIYAQSNDIWIPNAVICELFHTLFGDAEERRASAEKPAAQVARPAWQPTKPPNAAPPPSAPKTIPMSKVHLPASAIPDYVVGHILELLATDPRTAAHDVQITIGGQRILLKGDVSGAEQKEALESVIREHHPGYVIDNQVRITEVTAPDRAEDLL